MDFIPYLPLREGCDQLWVIIDRYTKMAYFIPLKKMNNKAEDLATIFTTEIWRLHGIPGDIMSDRDPRFISKFWKSLIPHSVYVYGCRYHSIPKLTVNRAY
jgi:hypothetical protein